MDKDNCDVAASIISNTYIQQGSQALVRRRKLIKTLLSQRRLPERGWDDATIEMLVQDAALMDSNNFLDNVGVGEREARVASDMVARRHYRLAHGVGRSGEVAAEQPKAAGSSLLAKLTHCLAADALALAGMAEVGAVLVVPLATGMALALTLLALRPARPARARYVVWPRIDQKTCLKCITAAGYEPLVVAMRRDGDQLVTDTAAVQQAIERVGAEAVACVLTTTSCFAPRAADDVVGVAKLCQRLGVPHVINNAYGVQSAALCALVTSAWRKGRVDAVVQSTDKNFMVPVGGAIIAAPKGRTELVNRANSLYPGRASMSPLLDLLITLLHWGADGWRAELAAREALFESTQAALTAFAAAHGERVLATPGNPISLALTLDTIAPSTSACGASSNGDAAGVGSTHAATASGAGVDRGASAAELSLGMGVGSSEDATFLGSMLFARCASGSRVVGTGKLQSVAGVQFSGYGAHCDSYPHAYLTVASALGTTPADIDEFLRRLGECLAERAQRCARRQGRPAAAASQ